MLRLRRAAHQIKTEAERKTGVPSENAGEFEIMRSVVKSHDLHT
jgi:hypothetical protein